MTIRGYIAFCAGLLAGFGNCTAQAQAEHGLLRGVERLEPYVLPLDKDSETCGIKADDVRQLLNEAASEAPFSLDGTDYVLFVRLSSLPKHGDCFSSIDLGVYWEGDVALPESTGATRAKVKLWENGTILISPRKRHWQETAGIIRHLLRNLEAAWLLDNGGSG